MMSTLDPARFQWRRFVKCPLVLAMSCISQTMQICFCICLITFLALSEYSHNFSRLRIYSFIFYS